MTRRTAHPSADVPAGDASGVPDVGQDVRGTKTRPRAQGVAATGGPVLRLRRGRVVEVPPEWVGQVTSRRTINARPPKLTGKARRALKRTRPEETDAERRAAVRVEAGED